MTADESERDPGTGESLEYQHVAAELSAMVADHVRQMIDWAEGSADQLRREALQEATADREAVKRSAAMTLARIDLTQAKVTQLLKGLREDVVQIAEAADRLPLTPPRRELERGPQATSAGRQSTPVEPGASPREGVAEGARSSAGSPAASGEDGNGTPKHASARGGGDATPPHEPPPEEKGGAAPRPVGSAAADDNWPSTSEAGTGASEDSWPSAAEAAERPRARAPEGEEAARGSGEAWPSVAPAAEAAGAQAAHGAAPSVPDPAWGVGSDESAQETPPADDEAGAASSVPADGSERRFETRPKRRRGGLFGWRASRLSKCAACGRKAGSRGDDSALEDWQHRNDLDLCPDCQAEGWRLPRAGPFLHFPVRRAVPE